MMPLSMEFPFELFSTPFFIDVHKNIIASSPKPLFRVTPRRVDSRRSLSEYDEADAHERFRRQSRKSSHPLAPPPRSPPHQDRHRSHRLHPYPHRDAAALAAKLSARRVSEDDLVYEGKHAYPIYQCTTSCMRCTRP
jgi:hypothetical protein